MNQFKARRFSTVMEQSPFNRHGKLHDCYRQCQMLELTI